MSVDQLVPTASRERHAGLRLRYLAEPHRRPMGRGLVLSVQRSDGRLVPVEISLSPVETSDSFLTVASIRDISERLEDSARLRRHYEQGLQAYTYLTRE